MGKQLLWLVLATIGVGCNGHRSESHSRAETPADTIVEPSDEAPHSKLPKVKHGYPLKAIATTGMVADIVRVVGGKSVSVEQILGAGVDPHLYKATRDDVHTIMSGDIVFYSGLMLEGKMSDTLIRIARSKPVMAVTEQIPPSMLLEPEDFAGHYDPHVWNDVTAWSYCVDAVASVLSEFDSQNEKAYSDRAAGYKQELAALHAYGVDAIGSIPVGSRVLITSHDAFNYFGRAYGLDVFGVQGLSTESEAGLQRINDLVDMIVKRKIPAVFVESSVPRKNIDALLEGARAKGHSIVVGGSLFSDAMGEMGTYEGTYLGMLDHNITQVARALGGQAPLRGMQGKLSASDEAPAK
ncbi:MAG: zinc ABC transporter substrate-binding protein [Planctomycetota bacterium]|nr:zinc ABC transporter substrate-binding protein [Planctomycetota bacterium]MDA1178066.1 zinc ABC transporter substrate-binding protein [Planctomycetota bacterium]